jgi:uncharacterized membrane protein required for colicin V production
MVIIDIIFLVILIGFIFYGFFKGFVRIIGDFIGFIAGAYIAAHYYLEFASLLSSWGVNFGNLAKIISFLLLFSISSKLVSMFLSLFKYFFKAISLLPFVKTINRLLGAALAFAMGSLSLSLLLYFFSKYINETGNLAKHIAESSFVPWLLKLADILTPLLPEALQMIKSKF